MTTDDDRVYWWTGSQTVALDAVDLTPDGPLPDMLGRATVHGNRDGEAVAAWPPCTSPSVIQSGPLARARHPAVVPAPQAKYPQYREHPPAGAVYRIAMDELRSWRTSEGR